MSKLVNSMKIVLGSNFTLYMKVHACHWNVEGVNFVQYHQFFGDMYTTIWQSLDDIAEHIRQLDAYAPASLERMVELSRIKGTNEVMSLNEVLLMLLEDNDVVMASMTEALHLAEEEDRQGLVDFLAGRLAVHSKFRWMLRAASKPGGG